MTGPSRPQAVRTLRRQGAPAGIYASKYDPALGQAICDRLARGESLRSICRADASMPTEKTVWNWGRAHPEFAAARDNAIGAARVVALAEQQARDALRRERTMAGRGSRTGRVAWNRGVSGYGPDIAEAICERLAEGEPLTAICRDPDMPCVMTVYYWLRAEPAFVEAYRLAKEVAMDVLVQVTTDTAQWLGSEGKSTRLHARRMRATYRRCAQLAPKRYAAGVYRVEADEG